jgi:hypothetical protein
MPPIASDKKDKKSWLDHPGKVALVGAFIILMGQFGATIFPIVFGPDLSDYNLLCDPVYHDILIDNNNFLFIDNNTGYKIPEDQNSKCYCEVQSIIRAVNFNRIQNYGRDIYLSVYCPPGFEARLSDPIIRSDKPVFLKVNINLTYLMNSSYGSQSYTQFRDKYPLIIEGIGADGKKRNCTMIIETGSTNEPKGFAAALCNDLCNPFHRKQALRKFAELK